MALRRLALRLEKLILRRERVGTDGHGNVYFRALELNRAGEEEERRWVATRGDAWEYEPGLIPAEWMRWLHKKRDAPPTAADLARYEAERGALAARVAALEAEEERRRLRMEARGGATAAAAAPSMGRFLEQLGGRGYGEDGAVPSSSTGSGGAGGDQAEPPQAPEGGFEPQAWTSPPTPAQPAAPGGPGGVGEPSGSGDTFQPGAWKPGV